MVEYIDSYFLQQFSDVKVSDNAKINSESPAWHLIDCHSSLENLSYD
jgi:hypothetical protein